MRESNKLKVIGIGGCARAGKDTFASILIKQLELKGKRVKRVALAGPLKAFCDEFCQKNLGISAFTQNNDEKLMIRPMLVWFGDAKRKQTNGRFWVDLADKTIKGAEAEGYDYAIVTDVRYDHYDRDEAHWLKLERKGTLVHISQFSWDRPVTNKVSVSPLTRVFVPPANDHEMINDPKVAKKAHVRIEWENVGRMSESELLAHPSLNKHVHDFIQGHLNLG